MRADRGLTFALALTTGVVCGAGVSAHRLDEYLQATRLDLRPDAVAIELDLTPGADVAASIVATMDRDGNGSVSAGEERAYAERIMGDLTLRLDGAPLVLRLASSTFPSVSAFRDGEGTIRLRLSARHASLSAGAHELQFRNEHLTSRSVYLANALVPESASMSVVGQRRDERQRDLTIDYLVGPRPSGFMPAWLLAGLAPLLLARWFAGRVAKPPMSCH